MSNKTTFGEWLKGGLQDKKQRPVDLARLTGLGTGVISNLMNNKRNPGIETCRIIADAWQIRPEEVMRAAGLLPDDPMTEPFTAGIAHLVAQLPQDERIGVHEFIKLRLRLLRGKRPHTTREHSTSG